MKAAWLDLLFPRVCAGCGAEVAEAGSHLCWDCLADLQYIQPPFCDRCGDPVSGRVDHAFTCPLCIERGKGFDRARSAVRYEGAVAAAVRNLKYNNHLWVIPDLGGLLEAAVRVHYADLAFDLVSWVPLHHARRRSRGFNQSAELARDLARRLGIPAGATARRIRATPSQTRLTVPKRADNVRDAFRARSLRRLGGCRVLLVDDVMTTGATTNACAAALKDGGAASVSVITVARG
jgi:ComF family protein